MKRNHEMGKKELTRRYLIFCISLLIIALGISVITRSDLGTSPITSVPYVASLNTSISLGTYFFLFTIVLICLQLLMLGKKGISGRKMELLMQFPVAFVLSVFTDLAMWLTAGLNPGLYYIKIISLIIGCIILAAGICLEVIADVTMISAEYTIQFATMRLKKDFGTIKVGFDVTLVLIAILCSLVMSGRIEGVREGTVITALITGPFVRLIMPRLFFIKNWLTETTDNMAIKNTTEQHLPLVITISREYGSGGHQLGELLAKQLGITFYDKELISLVAKESKFSEEFVLQNEQKLPNSLLYQMIMQDYEAPLNKSLSYDDALFVAQSRVIRRISSENSCVIVGRCANYILRNRPNTINIFLYADMSYKINRVISEYGVSSDKALETIRKIDKNRKEHYFHYTGLEWGNSRNYHISLDTSMIPISSIIGLVKNMYNTCSN